MSRIKSTTIFDSLTSIIDTINLERDPAVRLASFAYLADKFNERVLPERDKAAYEARKKYAAFDVAEVAACDPKNVYYWSGRHVRHTGEEPRWRTERTDMSGAIDLTKRLGIYRRVEGSE